MPSRRSRSTYGAAIALAVLLIPLAAFYAGTASASPTTITVYQSTIPVNIKGAYSASSWTDTPTVKEPNSGITYAFKQNGTGWLFLLMWQTSPSVCYDTYCYGGIELGPLSNTAEMGSPTSPTIMVLASPSFQASVGHAVDEFISTGDQTPSTVESSGYTTQSVCGALTLTGTTYTVQCYRPFKLTNASPYDFPTLGVGSTIEIAFAVGEFSQPGLHSATGMTTYVLTFSSNTYTPSSTTSSSASSTTSSSATTSKSTTTSSSSSSTSTTSTAQTTSSTSSKSTTSSATTSSSSSASTTSSSSTTSTSSTSITITTTFTVPSTSSSTGSSTSKQSTSSVATTGGSTVTMTVTGPTSTITGPTTTITGPTTTVTQPASTATTTVTSTSQSSSSIPIWVYGAMILLLAIGLAAGYVVAGPRLKKQ